MTPILACLAMLNPDAALACVMHNPHIPPIVLGDTGTGPDLHGRPLREYGDPHFDSLVCSHVTGSCLMTFPDGSELLFPFPIDHNGTFLTGPLQRPPGT